MPNNIAVLYKTKYGSTRTYAKWISDKTHGDLYDISNVTVNHLLNNYDFIVFVGALYAGKLSSAKYIKKFYKKLKEKKKLYCVMVGITNPKNQDLIDFTINKNFKSDEKDYMKFFSLRGELDFQKLKLHHALMMHMLTRIISNKTNKTDDEIMLLENYGKKISFLNKNSIDEIVSDIKNKNKELKIENN